MPHISTLYSDFVVGIFIHDKLTVTAIEGIMTPIAYIVARRNYFSAIPYQVNQIYFDIQCCTLLNLLGIPCIKSAGEAEALCAWLDIHQVK